jgi:2,4-dienoyl-CoA reductase (NADPH2)
MIEKFKINLTLEQEVTIDLIKQIKPDFIISAEGAVIAKPPIDGISDAKVISAWDLLRDDPVLGNTIAIIGGGSCGLETAEYIAMKETIDPETLYFLFKYNAESYERLHELIHNRHKKITIFEMSSKVGQDVGKSTKWILLNNINNHNIEVLTGAKVIAIKDGEITYDQSGATNTRKFDTVINATGAVSVRKLADRLRETGIPYKIVGDSNKPATILQAIHEGFMAVMDIK